MMQTIPKDGVARECAIVAVAMMRRSCPANERRDDTECDARRRFTRSLHTRESGYPVRRSFSVHN
jgi:hypothetical protein